MSLFDRRDPPGLQGGLTFRMNLSNLSDWSLNPWLKYQKNLDPHLSTGIEASASIFGKGKSSFNIDPYVTYQNQLGNHLLETVNLSAHYTKNGIGTNQQNPSLLELTGSGALTLGSGNGIPSKLNTFHANNSTAAQDPFNYSITAGRNYTYSFGRDENNERRGKQRTGYLGLKVGNISAGSYNDADRLPFGFREEEGADQYRSAGIRASINDQGKSVEYTDDLYYGKSDRLPNKIDPSDDLRVGNHYYDRQHPYNMALNNGQETIKQSSFGLQNASWTRFGAQAFWPSNGIHDSTKFHRLFSQYNENNTINNTLRGKYLKSYNSYQNDHLLERIAAERDNHRPFEHYTE